ncbi:MAG: hypothetical protein AAGB05_11850 [Pseudomonadota bacterium]
MPFPLSSRIVTCASVLLALGACTQEPQSAVNSSAAARPAELKTVNVTEEQRRELSREAQLQTPLSLRPEDTGGPTPRFHANGAEIGRDALVAGGVSVDPDVRVWQRWTAGTRQIYGSEPTAFDPIVQPVVVVPQ